MSIILGIDGTGGGNTTSHFDPMWRLLGEPTRADRYDAEMAASFVRKITNTGKPNHKYLRGPATFGGGLVAAVNEGHTFVGTRRRLEPEQKVLLTGYSRGAAGVVAVAEKLNRDGVVVQAMLLFDCVCRHVSISASDIPGNVRNVLHVRRSPASNSRGSFGNAGLNYTASSTAYQTEFFVCTHGGVGGTPWPGSPATALIDEGVPDGLTNITFGQDARISATVWAFVQPFLRTHGFDT